MDGTGKATCEKNSRIGSRAMVWLNTWGWVGRRVISFRRASLAKKANLGDGFFELWKGHGTWSARHDQLQYLGIRRPLNTTEIGHHNRHGPAHTGTATDHDPVVRKMSFDPAHSLIQQNRFGFGILRKWNPPEQEPTGWPYGKFRSNQEHRTNLWWWFGRVVDISNQQTLGNKMHRILSIGSALVRSRRNLNLSPHYS
jgi:hypothetical protein